MDSNSVASRGRRQSAVPLEASMRRTKVGMRQHLVRQHLVQAEL